MLKNSWLDPLHKNRLNVCRVKSSGWAEKSLAPNIDVIFLSKEWTFTFFPFILFFTKGLSNTGPESSQGRGSPREVFFMHFFMSADYMDL